MSGTEVVSRGKRWGPGGGELPQGSIKNKLWTTKFTRGASPLSISNNIVYQSVITNITKRGEARLMCLLMEEYHAKCKVLPRNVELNMIKI